MPQLLTLLAFIPDKFHKHHDKKPHAKQQDCCARGSDFLKTSKPIFY